MGSGAVPRYGNLLTRLTILFQFFKIVRINARNIIPVLLVSAVNGSQVGAESFLCGHIVQAQVVCET